MKRIFNVTLEHNTFDVLPGETILEGAIRNEVPFPSSCASGSCGACRTKVIEGKTEQFTVKRIGLSAEEYSNGYILACISSPLTDMKVNWKD